MLTLCIAHTVYLIHANFPGPGRASMYPWGISRGHGPGLWPPEVRQVLSWCGAVESEAGPSILLQLSLPLSFFLCGHDREYEVPQTLAHAGSNRELITLLSSGKLSHPQRNDHLDQLVPRLLLSAPYSPFSTQQPKGSYENLTQIMSLLFPKLL